MTDSQVRPDTFNYYSVDDLQNMSLQEVEAVWDLVPTERQKEYRRIYDRTRRTEGAVSDELELKMVNQMIAKYQNNGFVPVGNYWVPVPPKIKTAAATNAEPTASEVHETSPKTKKPPLPMILLAVGCVLIFGFLFLRGAGGKSTTKGKGTPTPTATATAVHTATPTPLALDAQDSIIRGGDVGAGVLYPVNLRVILGTEEQPRIFVVQRRLIQTTEWIFEDNPDTASYINGLNVRPIVGIPWSEENAALFNAMDTNTTFILRMNTGASLHFRFATQSMVNRGDTSVFQQTGPGLVVALIGERDKETDEATPNRVVVLASYISDLELSGGILSSVQLPTIEAPTPTITPTPVQRVDVQLISAQSLKGRVEIRLRIFNERQSRITIDSKAIWIIYGYSARPVGPSIAAEIKPFDLEPNQATDLTLLFAWHGEPYATFGVLEDYQFAITFGKEK